MILVELCRADIKCDPSFFHPKTLSSNLSFYRVIYQAYTRIKMKFSSIILFIFTLVPAYAYPTSYYYKCGYTQKNSVPVIFQTNPSGLFEKSRAFIDKSIGLFFNQVAVAPEKSIPLKIGQAQISPANHNLKLAFSSLSADVGIIENSTEILH